ncbi:PHD finger protein ING2 [Cinnamomum micranthum f. kanehirae]|uniref:PHD finger protein ING2 n=1 Tax=Cinnamomum micranthum f. kanehirae TaxID=337451 RepID=A0A3S3R0U8_9MAGN|nr:PHD finger protein ING2 [Cinnamomum micranthum f. kanehirae]
MPIPRTGVFIDDYLEYSSTLPSELQRLLNTITELDERSQATINQTRDQTKYCLWLTSQQTSEKENPEEDDTPTFEKMQKEIETNQVNALRLSTEKVLLAREAYDLIDNYIKRLDEDLNQFAEVLKQEGKIPRDEPAILPPLPLLPKLGKRKSYFRVPALVDADLPSDPNEPTYCVCNQVSFGDMIECDNVDCEGGEWFHYACVGLTPGTSFRGHFSAAVEACAGQVFEASMDY